MAGVEQVDGARQSVITIDLGGLGKPSGRVATAKMMSRAIVMAVAAIFLAIFWFFGVIVLFATMTGDADSTGAIIVIVIGLAIAAAPFLYLLYWLVSRKERYDAGIDGLARTADYSEAELAGTVPHLGVPLRVLIDAVQAFATSLGKPSIVRENDPEKRRKSRNLRLRIPALAIAGVVLGTLTGSIFGYFPLGVAVVTYPVVLLQSRKLLQPSAQALLAQDKRRQILLLRSFRDDEIKSRQRVATPLGDILTARRFEQGLAGPLGAFGPVIAIGKPGEEMPQIGAARAYLGDQEWQPMVLRWMNEARLIVMIAGNTEWIRWELDRILEMDRSRHLLIVVPPVQDKDRWPNVLMVLSKTRWSAALASLDTKGLLLVQLRPDGKVIAIRRAGKPFMQDYHLAISIAIYQEFCAQAA